MGRLVFKGKTRDESFPERSQFFDEFTSFLKNGTPAASGVVHEKIAFAVAFAELLVVEYGNPQYVQNPLLLTVAFKDKEKPVELAISVQDFVHEREDMRPDRRFLDVLNGKADADPIVLYRHGGYQFAFDLRNVYCISVAATR
jgi:hypothetical protein